MLFRSGKQSDLAYASHAYPFVSQYVNPIALEAIAMLAMYLGLILWLFVETR